MNIAFNEFRDDEILSLKLFFIGYISLYFDYGRKVKVHITLYLEILEKSTSATPSSLSGQNLLLADGRNRYLRNSLMHSM